MKDMIMSIILVAAVVVPTWLLIRASGKTKRLLKKELIRLNQGLPAIHDIWSHKAIAVSAEKMLTYIDMQNHQELTLDVRGAEAHLLLNENRYTTGAVDPKNMNTLDLVISWPGESKKLNIYDSKEDDPMECGHYLGIAKKYQSLMAQAAGKKVKA